jgi:hypothetical protein
MCVERFNEGYNCRDIYPEPVQKIAQQRGCLNGVQPRCGGNEVRTDRLAGGGRFQ